MEVTSATTATTAANQNKFAELESSEFVRILIEELQNQDPFSPNDSAAILEQLSSLRNIESQTLLGDQIGELVKQNQVAAAGNMIGKLVQGIDTSNRQSEGVVTSVRVTDDGVFLELDSGRTMDIAQVTQIAELAPSAQDDATPQGDPAAQAAPVYRADPSLQLSPQLQNALGVTGPTRPT